MKRTVDFKNSLFVEGQSYIAGEVASLLTIPYDRNAVTDSALSCSWCEAQQNRKKKGGKSSRRSSPKLSSRSPREEADMKKNWSFQELEKCYG